MKLLDKHSKSLINTLLNVKYSSSEKIFIVQFYWLKLCLIDTFKQFAFIITCQLNSRITCQLNCIITCQLNSRITCQLNSRLPIRHYKHCAYGLRRNGGLRSRKCSLRLKARTVLSLIFLRKKNGLQLEKCLWPTLPLFRPCSYTLQFAIKED